MIYKGLFVIASILLIMSCAQEEKKTEEPQISYLNAKLPAIPIDQLQTIVDSSTFGDLVFTKVGMSMGLNNIASVQNSVKYINPNKGAPANNCSSDARIIYSTAKGILKEADLFFTEGCGHIVFLSNGIAESGCLLTETGKTFYRQILNDYNKAQGK